MSRFPKTSETFIVRELDALDRRGQWEVGLRSLFGSPEPAAVHPVAVRWAAAVRRPRAAGVARGLCWALRRAPRALFGVLCVVVREHARHPAALARALVTVALATGHARELAGEPGVRIHAHFATYPALAAWVCHRLAGVRYGFTAHAHDLYVDRTMLAAKVEAADYVVTVSEFNRRLLAGIPGAPDTPVHVVRCGIDSGHYPFRARAVPCTGPVRALCVASLEGYKGHRVLFEALALGGPGVDRVELRLVGDGPLRQELAELATSSGLGRRVRFLGRRSELEVRRLLAAADLFVLPSVVADNGQMEGLPVALIEALASGVPTVSTALSGIPEIVLDGVTGLLARPGSARSLRDTLERAIADVQGAPWRARAGRDLVESRFELESSIDELLTVLGGDALGVASLGGPR